jgi:hypothetical protein
MDKTSRLAKRFVAALSVAALGAITLVASGGGGGGEPPPPPVTVSIAPAVATVKIGQTQQFAATVSGSTNTAVSWSISGPGCSGAACGTVSTAGLYTAPAIVPDPPTVSVRAVAQADATQAATAALTISSDVQLAVWPPLARIAAGGSRQFLRTLTGHANDAVTWSVAGSGCSGAACGTVSTSGHYAAPAAVAGATTVTLRARSVVDPGKSATATIELAPLREALLSGTYAYLHRGVLNGYDGVQAGIFTADGAGVLRNGQQDSIVPAAGGGSYRGLGFSGTYTIGADNRGLLSFALTGLGTVDWRSTHTASGERGFMQPFYNTAARGNAELHRADPSAFANTGLTGNYVFQFNGADASGNRIANLGRFSANGSGTISAGLIDSTDGTTLTQNAAFSGSYNIGSSGRGTMQWVIPRQGTFNFALYVVSAERMIVVANDDVAAGVPLRIGYALRQSGSAFDNASLTGTYVFDLMGRRNASAAVATTGLMTSDGAGAISGMLDRNDHYVFSAGQSYTGTYSVAADGRGTLASSALPTMIFYLTGNGLALLMEGPGTSVQTGTLQRQLAAPYSTANLLGQFASSSSPPARLVSLSVTGQTTYDGQGNATSALDIATPCSLAADGFASANFSVATTGRINVRDAMGVQHAGGYLVDPMRYRMTMQRASVDATCDEVVHHYSTEQ